MERQSDWGRVAGGIIAIYLTAATFVLHFFEILIVSAGRPTKP